MIKAGERDGSTAKADRDAEEAAVIDREKNEIGVGRATRLGDAAPGAPWCGIGLSGGGIRSASLSLGVLQALAENDLIRRFDYMSSVSGGGYLAASLQWWWSRKPRADKPDPNAVAFGLGPNDFPYGPARPDRREKAANETAADQGKVQPLDRAIQNMAFLRAHGSYLTPGNGLSAWSMLGVLVRTVLISLLTWIPLLVACFSVVMWLDIEIVEDWAKTVGLWSPLPAAIAYRWSDACQGTPECDLRYPAIFAVMLYVVYSAILIFLSAAVLFGLISRAPQDNTAGRHAVRDLGGASVLTAFALAGIRIYYGSFDGTVILLMAAGLIFIGVSLLVIGADLLTTRSLNASYWLRRRLEQLMGQAFIPSVVMFAVATIPIGPYLLLRYGVSSKYGFAGALVGVVSGTLSALYGYYTFLRSIVPGLVGQITATAGSIVYLYTTLVAAYVLSVVLFNARDFGDPALIRLLIVGSIVLALSLGMIANINFVGLHRFYRDRLMEAFMPNDAAVSALRSTYSPVADNLSVANLRTSLRSDPAAPDFLPRPYPLINANVILINDADQKVASRGGDNFIISPLFVGSGATGWQDTVEYIEQNGPLTLASAMAASGAAASASAGYVGTGITMNPLVAAVMSLLNIRLGLWVGNPFRRKVRRIRSIPTFLNPGLVSDVFGQAHTRENRFIELTDGGHFENLALYELVRRKLCVILIVDGEADPTISLRSLVSATRRIEQDFGARLSFFSGLGPERLIMVPGQGYPAGVRYAAAPFLVGQLTYSDGTTGTLIYVKSTLIRQMDFTTSGYLASNPDFPHQSTVDQFFDPDQFDAYRYLGYESASQAITSLNLVKTIGDPAAIIARYQSMRDDHPEET